ncbi:TPM domain-containing protein [Pelosinus fermentans]|uniref:TPM domain-containing protein n=1 Tax=Pelosinus fermentans B4 TaxID=1149862 RepID=I8RKY9_9FIRM|nr:TPM domain-containing protein [Pelosinus fermentans]EIW20968.1 protein of unknown function DUF477 [Pelosinus fermentans B4]EIW27164.1 protein of unknown function DUF477 [Pelosinus fermentans A11]OAM92919.1 protein of unknown function DUF477 [Pelosinus fermentans DSM 17108]SDQ60986.1 uncharacterized protein SAMN04515679_0990 [Pelosinus fermentans]
MKKRLAWIVFVAYLLIAAVAWAQPQVPPAPTNSIYIQDYAGVVSPETKSRINSLGSQLAAKTKAQIVVMTTKTLEGAPLEEYSLEVLRQWGVGDKTLNNGVLILVAVDDKQSRIEVGYGLEGALPDAKTGRIQDNYMIPYFQQGDYDKGILNGYLTVATEVAKEYNLELKTDAKPVQRAQAATQEGGWDTLPWWAKIAIAVGVILLLMMDWLFFGGAITYMLLSVLSRRGGGGGGGGGFGGGSGGGGGSSRRW